MLFNGYNTTKTTFLAAALALVGSHAMASSCEIDQTHAKQVAEFNLIVQNKTSDKLRVSLWESRKSYVSEVKKGKSIKRSIDTRKDQEIGSGAMKSSGHGVSIQVWDQYTTSYRDLGVLKFEASVVNTLTEDGPETKVKTEEYGEGKKFNRYDIMCSADFDGKGKNAWDLKVTLKDK